MSSQTQSSVLTIDLGALADNYRMFQSMVTKTCEIAGVIKANAYGIGAEQVFNKLKSLNCPQFFVANLDEALSLRKHDNTANIAVFGSLIKGAEKEYIENKITPVLNSPEDIKIWQKTAKDTDKKLPAFIHFDTGMNRLGLSSEEASTLIDNLDILNGINVQMMMSHFACADENEHILTQEQADKFADIAKHFPNTKKSLANSSGLFANSDYHYDMARPGYALYGGNPTPHIKNPVKSVVSLKSRILQTREVKKGQSIGYGASHIFKKDTRTATLALGYADGFLRSSSNKAKLYYNDIPCNVIGRVSMDLVTIDVGHIDENTIHQGDWVEVLGKNQNVDDLSITSGTIGYEILTSLGARYNREYINA